MCDKKYTVHLLIQFSQFNTQKDILPTEGAAFVLTHSLATALASSMLHHSSATADRPSVCVTVIIAIYDRATSLCDECKYCISADYSYTPAAAGTPCHFPSSSQGPQLTTFLLLLF